MSAVFAAHENLTDWRSLGVATARAEGKSFVARGMTDRAGEKFFHLGGAFTLVGAGGKAPSNKRSA